MPSAHSNANNNLSKNNSNNNKEKSNRLASNNNKMHSKTQQMNHPMLHLQYFKPRTTRPSHQRPHPRMKVSVVEMVLVVAREGGVLTWQRVRVWHSQGRVLVARVVGGRLLTEVIDTEKGGLQQ